MAYPQPLGDVGEIFGFGGVDSRSNPLNMPSDRAIRCVNFVPQQAGYLRLRRGYTQVPLTGPGRSSTPIHSIIDFHQRSGGTVTNSWLIGQAADVSVRDANGVQTDLFAGFSGAKWSYYRANNHIYFGNGQQMLWFDGAGIRPVGLRALAPFEVANVSISIGTRALSSAEQSSVTVTGVNSGGLFGATSSLGYQFWAMAFDVSINELGPAVPIGAPITFSPGLNKVSIGVLPNWSGVNGNWVKLIGRTGDGTSLANFCILGGYTVTALTRTSGVTTATSVGHGLAGGNIIVFSNAGDISFNGIFQVTSTTANTFTYSQTGKPDVASGGGGIANQLPAVSNAGTSVDITNNAVDSSQAANAAIGVPATTTQTDTPGVQFFASIYDIAGGGHVGNRIAIGPRISLAQASIVIISGLPNLGFSSPEFSTLLGRTLDGAKLPYTIIDNGGNFISVPNGGTSIRISQAQVDFTKELPTRNGLPPAMNKFARVGDRIYGNTPNSSTIYLSGSQADSNQGVFLGDWAQAWAPTDIETFPTDETVTGVQEYDYECWVFSALNCAILVDLAGIRNWQGPYAVGLAGQRAFCKTPHGPYWVTAERQLATKGEFGPIVISEEYEAALLAKIGIQYIPDVECNYIRDPLRNIDHVVIKARDASGAPFEVIHDFRLRDAESPYGQGYQRVWAGVLAGDYSTAAVLDGNGSRQIWAGGPDGKIYQLNDGLNDAGTEFQADYLMLRNFGADRASVSSLEFQGDKSLKVGWLPRLNAPGGLKDIVDIPTLLRRGNEKDFQVNANMKDTEVMNAYVRLQLTSHSPDAPATDLSDPPHLPFETYGCVYVLRGEFETERGHS